MVFAGSGLSSSAAIVCSSAIAILTALEMPSSKVFFLLPFNVNISPLSPAVLHRCGTFQLLCTCLCLCYFYFLPSQNTICQGTVSFHQAGFCQNTKIVNLA
jgi:hypothetical protein